MQELANLVYSTCFLIQDHKTKVGTDHSGLGPPTSVINNKMLQTFLHANMMRDTFSIEVPSSQITVACVKLTKTKQTTTTKKTLASTYKGLNTQKQLAESVQCF